MAEVNQKEFAKIVGVSDRQVRNWIADGMPVAIAPAKRGAAQTIDTVKAIQWIVERAVEKRVGPGEKKRDEQASKLELVHWQTQNERLKHEREAGKLVPIADVEVAVNECFVFIGTQMDALSGRMASELATTDDPAVIRRRILDEQRRIRAAAADGLASYGLGAALVADAASAADAPRGRVGKRQPKAPARKRRARAVQK